LPIKQIARDVGYTSVRVFDRHFSRELASTPTKWRAREAALAQGGPFR
jgi:AraC-like DNA-binding protein